MTSEHEKRPSRDLEYRPVTPVTAALPVETSSDAATPANSGTVASLIQTVKKIERRPTIAHLLRATERFNERLGNQFGRLSPIFPSCR